MAYRFTNTDKWSDGWYSDLPVLSKLIFNFLCDKCDIAGFIEVTPKTWAAEIGCTKEQIIESFDSLSAKLVFSLDNSCLFIRNYVKHQKNLPLNVSNKSHIGILKRVELYSEKFGFQTVESFVDELIQRGFKGASKGLASPTGIGIGIGNGIGNGSIPSKEKEPEFSFEFLEHDPFKKAFMTWFEFRKKSDKPLTTQESIEAEYRNLKRFSQYNANNADEVVDYSISKPYTSLYPIEIKPKQIPKHHMPR